MTDTMRMITTQSGTLMRVPLQGKNTPRKSHFKCAVVGDAKCGKTSLLRSYTTKLTFPYTVESSRPLPSQYPVKQMVKGNQHTGTITDTDSSPNSLEKRLVAYSRADVVIICFSLVNKASFKSVRDIWIKELEQHCPNTPILLVGTQSDLVHNPNIKKKDIVTVQKIQKLLECQRIHEYVEASAFTKDGLSTVFQEAFNAAWIGPVRYVIRMKSVSTISLVEKLRDCVLPCMFNKKKP